MANTLHQVRCKFFNRTAESADKATGTEFMYGYGLVSTSHIAGSPLESAIQRKRTFHYM